MIHRILAPLASLRLTVALFLMAMVLIFVGTLAQATHGVWYIVDGYFRSLIAWIDLQVLFPPQLLRVPFSVPFPGGLTIGVLMVVNLLAAHIIRFKFTRKRVGIVMLHAGVIVLLVGEFVTGAFSDEGLMSIDVGASSSHVEDIREVELAIIDPSNPEHDRVIAFPESIIRSAVSSGEPLSHPELPFTLRIDKWIDNARLLRATDKTPATTGVGLDAFPEELPRVRGVDGAQTDTPAAYITTILDGSPAGTWMVYAGLIDAQKMEVGSQSLGIALRYKRTYKPYTLHLAEFRHDKFVGTQIARNFSSRVQLTDPSRGVDREVVIWMNNPLRHGGDTFYQASYKPDGSGTVLQVVSNPGAILPYLACGLVGVGMTLHFMLTLIGYLRRRSQPTSGVSEAIASTPLPLRVLPWVMFVLGLLLACGSLLRPVQKNDRIDMEAFATLPVSSGGRIKPLDTAARHVLMVAGGRQSIRTPEHTMAAPEFLLNLMAQPDSIRELPVVRVDHPDVLSLIGLNPEDVGRISLSIIEPHWEKIRMQAQAAMDIPAKQRDPFQRAIVSLYDRVTTILSHSSMVAPYMIPPMGPDDEWKPFHDAFLAVTEAHHASVADPSDEVPPMNPAINWYITMMTAYSQSDFESFNKALAAYTALLERDMPQVMQKASLEVLFNRVNLFLGAIQVYVLTFLLVCGAMLLRMRHSGQGDAWGRSAEGLRVSATALLWAAFLVHTIAIILRIYLQERPPVTNLYSSAVFVGWAAVFIGLLLEHLYKIGVAALGASMVGFATLIVAHNLGSDGDTMQMMQAVLDSNFWLATHVIVITLGYSATFLAGTLAAIYLLLGVFTSMLTKDRARSLSRMVYGVICFALLLSFVGTVLGGIWADQSWGRFWGWDPKENGAALIVLINAIILHARWGGMLRERGIMVLAVGGNIVTAWSWFGTNMLGVGLHSYGFMDSAVFWLMAFIISQLILMAIGLIPLAGWKSFRGNGECEIN